MQNIKKPHRHRVASTDYRPFVGPVAQPQNQAAHGNVTLHQGCRCGAVRRVNVNGHHAEYGAWSESESAS
jgi:hypothetical protein